MTVGVRRRGRHRAGTGVAEIVLYHHAQCLMAGVEHFADRLRQAGHIVHVPDLHECKVFATIEEGVAHAQQVGFGAILERGRVV